MSLHFHLTRCNRKGPDKFFVITCFQRKDALMSSNDGGGGVAESAAAHPGDAGGPGQGEEGAAPPQR